MITATITPKYVNAPKKVGGKYGNVKLEDGTSYAVPVALLPKFTAGTSTEIEWAEQTWGSDKVKVVADVKATASSPPAPSRAAVGNSHADKNERMIFITGI